MATKLTQETLKNRAIAFGGAIVLFGAASAIIGNLQSVNQLWMIPTAVLTVVSAYMVGYYSSPKLKK